MVTIADIAKEANVSVGTVSNVLNQKGNVSVKTIRKVEEIAKKLGYYGNPIAKSIRIKTKNLIACIIQEKSTELNDLVEGLKSIFYQNNYEIKIFYYQNSQEEQDVLREVSENRCLAVIAMPSSQQVYGDYYEILKVRQENIIFLNANKETAVSYANFYVGCSDISMSQLLIDYNKICLFIHEYERVQAEFLIAQITQENKRKCIEIKVYSERNHLSIVDSLIEENFDCIISFSKKISSIVSEAFSFFNSHAKIIAINSEKLFHLLPNHIMLFQNYYGLGIKLAKKLNQNICFDKKQAIKIEEPSIELSPPVCLPLRKSKTELTLLTIYTPTISALKKIKKNFEQQTNVKLKIVTKSYEEVVEILSTEQYKEYDLIRIGIELIPWFAQKVFLPLGGLDSKLDKLIDSFDLNMKKYFMQWQQQNLLLPFDPNVQMMFYRKDLFENQILQKLFYDQYKENLYPPKNYEELLKVAEFFTTCQDPENSVKKGISLEFENSILMATEILSAYYALGGDFLVEDYHIKFDIEILLASIQNYQKLMSFAKKEQSTWWDSAVNSYLNSETAVIITYANQLSSVSQSELANRTGYMNVPGDKGMLGGGSIGISKGCLNKEVAVEFLKWANHYNVAEKIVHLDGLTSNSSVFFDEEVHKIFPWLSQIDDIRKTGVRLNQSNDGYAINTQLFESILAKTVKKQIQENQTPENIAIRLVENLIREQSNLFGNK